MNQVALYQGDCTEVLGRLPSNSVHCVVTSPPYFGLRNYCDDTREIGSERHWKEHIDRLVLVFEEVRRVLHPSGLAFVNYGDCYYTGPRPARKSNSSGKRNVAIESGGVPAKPSNRQTQGGYKPKDLMGMPWRLAFAMQDAGWWLRSDIIWHKPNGLPSSVPDRFVPAHEYVFMFSKTANNYFDRDGVRIPNGTESSWEDYAKAQGSIHEHGADKHEGMQQKKKEGYKVLTHPMGAARRTVWSIPNQALDEDHHAAYPMALVEPLIKAATSEKGCCPLCRAPWSRIYQDAGSSHHGAERKRADAPGAKLSKTSSLRTGNIRVRKPVGWEQSCKCKDHDPVPCTVLDIFCGSGTTGIVAARLQRSFIGIELNPEYLEMSHRRIYDDQPLFNSVELL